jgi:hypothetical protein
MRIKRKKEVIENAPEKEAKNSLEKKSRGRPKGEPKVVYPITLYVTPEFVEQVKAISKSKDRSVAYITKRLLSDYLNLNDENAEKPVQIEFESNWYEKIKTAAKFRNQTPIAYIKYLVNLDVSRIESIKQGKERVRETNEY